MDPYQPASKRTGRLASGSGDRIRLAVGASPKVTTAKVRHEENRGSRGHERPERSRHVRPPVQAFAPDRHRVPHSRAAKGQVPYQDDEGEQPEQKGNRR